MAIRVGLFGCGTVGGGVIELLSANAQTLATRCGAPLEIAGVVVRDQAKDRVHALDRKLLVRDAETLLRRSDIDLFVEVMGGVEPARTLVAAAIETGRSVVTANKMLLALHGPELVRLAQTKGVDLAFEASVGGGIPVVRVLREALTSDTITRLYGIVNGTCNFILSSMSKDGCTYEHALREAQARGYAEADPTLDTGGHDAAHKLVVLAMLAFGARVDSASVPTEGIAAIEPIDHRWADRFGFVIKHLAVGQDHGDALELRVHPALVPKDATLANVGGVLNAIWLEGRALGPCLLSGRGAGAMPTAVSVVSDVVDVARARRGGASGLMTRGIRLDDRPLSRMGDVITRYFLRFQVYDRPGVLARITGALGDAGVSIEQLVQEGRGASNAVPVQVVMLTHEAREADLDRAMKRLENADFVVKPPVRLRAVAS